jgi:hypothetical protein
MFSTVPKQNLLEKLETVQLPFLGSSASTNGSDTSDNDAIDEPWTPTSSDTETQLKATTFANATDIQVSNDDLFQKNKARSRTRKAEGSHKKSNVKNSDLGQNKKAVACDEIEIKIADVIFQNEKAEADEVRIATTDLFQGQKARVLTGAATQVTGETSNSQYRMNFTTPAIATEAKVDEIKVAKDDLFQKVKARARMSSFESAKTNEPQMDEIKVTTADLFQQENGKAQTLSQSLADEIKITKDDLFQKEKARTCVATSVPISHVIADESKFVSDDLFAKEKIREEISRVTKMSMNEVQADQIKVGTDDLFHKEKAKKQTLSNTLAAEIKITKDDMFQKEKASTYAVTSVPTAHASTDVIKVTSDDMFAKQKTRAQTFSVTKAIKSEGSNDVKASNDAKQVATDDLSGKEDIKVTTEDLFRKEKSKASVLTEKKMNARPNEAKIEPFAMIHATKSVASANEIRIATDDLFQKEKDLFQKEKAKVQASAMTKTSSLLAEEMKLAKDDLFHIQTSAMAQLPVVNGTADVINVTSGDLFQKERARAQKGTLGGDRGKENAF